ncbi:MAG: site-specific integrase [Nitrospirae bacterium]|nr:MAG: site-specific integrase [Nitrospirota bacterium]
MSENLQPYKSRKVKGLYLRGRIWWITFTGPDGKRYYQSTGTTSKTEAEKILYQTKAEVNAHKTPSILVFQKTKKFLFKDLADEYEKWSSQQKGFLKKKNRIKHLKEYFGEYPLVSFNQKLIEQYQMERLRKGNANSTVNRYVTILKHMFRKAYEWEMVNNEIAEKVRSVKLLPEDNKRLRFLSKEECAALINAAEPHLKPILIVALNTGMRKGELLNLKWDQVDFQHGLIFLEKTKNGERREIPMNRTVRHTLSKLVRRLDIPYVFYNPQTGKPYKDIRVAFHTALKRAKIRDFRFHDLRHTFASHLVMAGVDLRTVQELLGHKTHTMTLRYTHLAPNHKIRAIEVLDDYMVERDKNVTIGL